MGSFPFPFLTIFLIGIVILSIKLRSSEKKQEEKMERFWEKEKQAKAAPDKDLSTIQYVVFPVDDFNMGEIFDTDTELIEESLITLSKTRMLNINGMTNTDIRLEYGASNLDEVAEYGENFSKMTMLICDYAKSLMEHDKYEEATKVLEYGMRVGSDISSNYTLLGDCYVKTKDMASFDNLIAEVEKMSLPRKKRVSDYLLELKNTGV
ncbi:MAG: hypothetical protein K6F00_07765 [Lachnospiraceae bacterium]|nr:hypothetical protein [Lachnospiraceae bacterium]